MTQSTKSVSPLRQLMTEDMALRKLAPKTQSGYIRSVEKLARFLGRSPDMATAEDLRLFQLHMSESGVTSTTINVTITGLRFLYEVTPMFKAALSVAYGAGLGASEVTHLKVTDIDSDRMIIHVVQGKGSKDRSALLSPELLKILRQWWRTAHAEGKMLKNGWLELVHRRRTSQHDDSYQYPG